MSTRSHINVSPGVDESGIKGVIATLDYLTMLLVIAIPILNVFTLTKYCIRNRGKLSKSLRKAIIIFNILITLWWVYFLGYPAFAMSDMIDDYASTSSTVTEEACIEEVP